MTSQRLLLFCLLAGLTAAPALAQTATPDASPATAPGPVATIDPAQTARARAEFDAWRTGTIDRSHYDAQLNAKISDADISDMGGHLRTVGTIASFTQLQRGTQNGSNYFVYKIVGSVPPPIAMVISFDTAGKVDGISFQPLVTQPSPTPAP
ncbi:MAG TPA: hypothetical protein VMD91_02855 [Candidatus Sulfotelmatobacter sp.]|nr:hypothetical protein [Candidatus Sulfotelmatobacter sp.]